MSFNCSKGDRVVLLDNSSQVFEGEVLGINQNLGRLLLKDVVQQPGNKVLEGYRHFDRNEIMQIRNYCKEESDPADDECSRDDSQKECEAVDHSEIKKLQSEYRYIKDFGTNFHVAISLLRKCTIIGLCAKDVSSGRLSRASLLAISTNSNIFIFDLLILGDEAFNKGVREILESPNVIKVVHDGRFLSDSLKHKHFVVLQNIRDVEAEDIMVVHQERRIIRNHTRSLDYLVKIYLNLEFTYCNISVDTWNERPVSSKLLSYLACFVSFLIPLQEMIEKTYLERLIKASDIYNKYLRDSDLFEVVQTDNKNTLKKQIIELVKPTTSPRTDDFKLPKTY